MSSFWTWLWDVSGHHVSWEFGNREQCLRNTSGLEWIWESSSQKCSWVARVDESLQVESEEGKGKCVFRHLGRRMRRVRKGPGLGLREDLERAAHRSPERRVFPEESSRCCWKPGGQGLRKGIWLEAWEAAGTWEDQSSWEGEGWGWWHFQSVSLPLGRCYGGRQLVSGELASLQTRRERPKCVEEVEPGPHGWTQSFHLYLLFQFCRVIYSIQKKDVSEGPLEPECALCALILVYYRWLTLSMPFVEGYGTASTSIMSLMVSLRIKCRPVCHCPAFGRRDLQLRFSEFHFGMCGSQVVWFHFLCI